MSDSSSWLPRSDASRSELPSEGNVVSFSSASSQNKAPSPASFENRQPPSDLAAERALLGAMFLTSQAISDSLEEGLQQWHFYSPAHVRIFDAVSDLYQAGQPVDLVTVANQLRPNEGLKAVGGEDALIDIQTSTPVAGHADQYARIVINHALLRRLIEKAHEVIKIGYSSPEDVGEAIDEAEAQIFAATQERLTDSAEHISALLEQSLDRMEMLYEKKMDITGIPTGFREYDKLLAGLQPSNLIVVGGRPSVGKTSFALGMALNVAKLTDKSVLYFSMEMSKLELAQRMVAAEAQVDYTRVRTGQLREQDWMKVTDAMSRLRDANIWIDDSPALTTMEVRAKARRYSNSENLGLVVIDYLQIMTPYGKQRDNRAVEVGEMSRSLKILAREIDCPVLALSQLSRSLEARTDKRPLLSDLRESGSIEQDADVVTFLYRDEMYNDESPDRGLAEVIVAKHRTGPVGKAKMRFIPELSLFANIDTDGWAA